MPMLLGPDLHLLSQPPTGDDAARQIGQPPDGERVEHGQDGEVFHEGGETVEGIPVANLVCEAAVVLEPEELRSRLALRARALAKDLGVERLRARVS